MLKERGDNLVEVRIALAKAKETTKAAPTLSSKPIVKAMSEGSKLVQGTLNKFFKKIGANNRLEDLEGPKFVPVGSPGIHVCNGCGKDCVNAGGRTEHQKYCVVVAENAERLQTSRASRREENPLPSSSSSAAAASSVEAQRVPGEVISREQNDEEVDEDEDTEREDAPRNVGRGRRGSTNRKCYTAQFKLRVVELAETLVKSLGKNKGAYDTVANSVKVGKSLVTKWVAGKDAILLQAKNAAGGKGTGNRGRVMFRQPRGPSPRFASAEMVVIVQFEDARERRVRVTSQTLQTWMRQAIADMVQAGTLTSSHEFEASSSWLHRFTSRHQLCVRRVTNKKVRSLEDRLPAIRKFHLVLQNEISKPGGDAHPVFGFYCPCNVYNMDQSPVNLSPTMGDTYERKGVDVVGITEKSSSDHRYATLTILLRLEDGVEQPFPSIIFKGTGKRISDEERAAYAPDVFVQFQAKAWTDSVTLEAWQNKFISFLKEDAHDGQVNAILFLDNLRAQTLDGFEKKFATSGVKCWYFPPNCTDIIQPVDRHVAVHIKKLMGKGLERRLVEDRTFARDWLGAQDGTYPAWKCRVLMTKLLSEAWKEFCSKKSFRELGLQTGCVMPKKGVDRASLSLAPIKIDGLNGVYDFEAEPLETVAPLIPALGVVATSVSVQTIEIQSSDDGSPDDGSSDDSRSTSTSSSSGDSSASSDLPVVNPKTAKKLKLSKNAKVGKKGKKKNVEGEPLDPKVGFEDIVQQEEEISPEDEIVNDPDALDEMLVDDTASLNGNPVIAPEGYTFEEKPNPWPTVSYFLRRYVYWYWESADGFNGWVISHIVSGPADPKSALRGVTMQLKCSTRLDKATPTFLRGPNHISVAFTAETYGSKWVLVNKI